MNCIPSHSRVCTALASMIAAFFGLLPHVGLSADESVSVEAAEIIETSGIQGGLIVHLGCGDGQLTAALRLNDRYQVHGLDRDGANVDTARQSIRRSGLYGDVAVDRMDGSDLPYIDNLINLVVVDEAGEVADEEIERVLTPGGVACKRVDGQWTARVKPRPKNIDDWTHFLHDAGGNAVAHDEVVGPPRHLQWVGNPRWSRHHDRMASMSALVSAGGRLFYIMDEGSRISIQMPSKWTLIARDAFNGTVLWKKPIPNWHHHLWPLKSGPTLLARRLVATGDTVFVTLGINAPVSAIDAATGEIRREYAGTERTEEIILSGDTLLLTVNPTESELADYSPKFNVGDQKRVFTEFVWNEHPRQVVGVDAVTGRIKWTKKSIIAPLTLCSDGDRTYFHDGDKVVSIDQASGEVVWSSKPLERRRSVPFNFGPKLVVHDGVLLFAGGERTMQAFDAKSGTLMWEAPHARGGYQSPEDLLVTGGLVWSAPTTSGRDSGIFTGRDLKTGEVKSEFPPNVETYWFHHRCYIAKATDRYILPSRTGIEFVDFDKKDWEIHHWVRGGCLYGVMPCNGLTYAPPHNCACYPEAKLYGLNALAPASASRSSYSKTRFDNRLERGPAFGEVITATESNSDWPTYRSNAGRSGYTKSSVPADLAKQWQTALKGKLSAPTVAGGKVFVAEVDAHTVHAFDVESGTEVWSYTTGGRVDSPPTIRNGRALFGSADGWVYCLQAADGQLIWRFRAAPQDRRLTAFEQLESVWPVSGSVLAKDNDIYFVAGRSNFLDGGLRFIRLKIETGEKLAESVIDDKDPVTGENLQERLQTLQMPVGLADILTSDGQNIYLRSQQFDTEGNRIDIGPHSGDAPTHGSVQAGSTAHLFAPMGFLDDTYFHRAYWVYGRSFAGGHNGYYQAGKFTPAGRLLVTDEENVYGFCRKPEYYRWTTTIEHHLFSASKKAPPQALSSAGETVTGNRAARRTGSPMIQFEKTPSIDPTGKALAVEAWVKAERPAGVVLARGGPAVGYALYLEGGKPRFAVRTSTESLTVAESSKPIVNRWTHLFGVLTAEKQVQLYVDGQLVGSAKAPTLISSDPVQSLEIGADDQGPVATYQSPSTLTGTIDEVRLYHGEVTAADVQARFSNAAASIAGAKMVVACSFDKGDGTDASGNKNHGRPQGTEAVEGKFGKALHLTGRRTNARTSGYFVQHHWTQDVPLMARAMTLADKTLFVAGPPDMIDEEQTFQATIDRDPEIEKQLAAQDAAFDGEQGGVLLAVSAVDGRILAQYELESLPQWDAMAAADGKLFVVTTDGRIVCFGP